jgi:pheromone shutdown protein TraB
MVRVSAVYSSFSMYLYLYLLLCLAPRAATTSSPPSIRKPQILTVRDASTGINVHIVGSMHYNPYSIQLARETVEKYCESMQLGSLVIESCPARWSKTLKTQPAGSLLREVLDNEMQAAAEVAGEYNVPVILGDQDISVTNTRIKETAQESIRDILNPLSGWKRIYSDTVNFVQLSSGDDRLSFSKDFLDINLLKASPFSFIRYPLAILLKSPLFFLSFATFVYVLDTGLGISIHLGSNPTITPTAVDVLTDGVETTILTFLELAILARPMLQAVLHERNVVLAQNIRQCCIELPTKSTRTSDVCVVAVLGMAHSNGVAKLLEQK